MPEVQEILTENLEFFRTVKVCLHIPTPSPSPLPSRFIIVTMMMDSLTGKIGVEPILPIKTLLLLTQCKLYMVGDGEGLVTVTGSECVNTN